MMYLVLLNIYRPQTKFAKVMFLQVSVCPHGEGAYVVAPGGCAWLLPGGGRVVAPGWPAWLLWGACVVVGGMHAWLPGGHA